MAQVAFEKNIGSEWVDVTTLATLTADEVYYIQNRGAGVLLAQENNAEPTDEGGTVVMPYKVLKYTNNGKLWVKSLSGLCTINITDKNAPEPAVETKWYNLMGFWMGEGMAGGYKVYDSEWQPIADMTEMQTIIAGGGTVAGAGFGFTGGDTQNIEVHVVPNINDDQTELAGEKSLWIRVTENGTQVDIPAEEATLTLSQDFLTLSWSYDTYAGTFTADMSDMNKPLLECGSVTHNGQACENAELMVKFIPASEPTKKTVWFPIEALDGFGEEVTEEGTVYNVNAIGQDGEDAYDIYFEQTLNPVAFQNVSVTKDGTTTSANMYMRIFSDAEPIDKQTSELTITTSDNYAFEWSSTDGYAGTFSIEPNPDSEAGYGYVYGEATKDGEVIGSGLLFVRAEV